MVLPRYLRKTKRRSYRSAFLFLLEWSLLVRGVELGDVRPIDHVPPRIDIVGAAVLVIEVVGVLPDIETEDRDLAFHHRRILIGGAGDAETATRLDDEPRPTATKTAGRSGLELRLEVVEAAKRGIDGGRKVTGGHAFGVRPHDVPEQVVIQITAAVIADSVADAFRQAVQVLHQPFGRLALKVSLTFERLIEIVGVGFVVLAVMDFHG